MRHARFALVTAVVLSTTLLASGPGWSQAVGLDASSKAAYDASIVAMSDGRDPTFSRSLILALIKLAAAEQPALSGPEAMRLFAKSPDEFYRRLTAHQGKSADELLAASQAL